MPGAAYMVSNMSSISRLELGVEARHRLRPRAQARVGEFQDGSQAMASFPGFVLEGRSGC